MKSYAGVDEIFKNSANTSKAMLKSNKYIAVDNL